MEGGRGFVAAGGLRLEGICREPLAAGAAARVAIRPEDLTPGDGPNTIEGRAEAVQYCGHDYLIDFLTADGQRLHARSVVRVAPGEALRCHVPTERVLVYGEV